MFIPAWMVFSSLILSRERRRFRARFYCEASGMHAGTALHLIRPLKVGIRLVPVHPCQHAVIIVGTCRRSMRRDRGVAGRPQ